MDDSVDERSPWSVQGMDDFLHYTCPECPFKHKCQEDFWIHAVQAHPGSKDHLDKIYCHQAEIKQEIVKDEEDVIEDVIEPESVLDQDLREEDLLQCYLCGTSLPKDPKIVYDHLVHNHGTYSDNMYGQPRKFQCGHCGEMFVTGFKLKSHAKKDHNMIEPIVEDDSGGGYRVEEIAYEDPPWIVNPESFPPACDTCGKTFTEKLGLRRHYKTVHLNHKPYKCNSCNFACFSQGPMKVHVISHRSTSKYVCALCNKPFRTKTVLKKHMDSKHKIVQDQMIEPIVADNPTVEQSANGYTIHKHKYVDPPWIVSPESFPHNCVQCGRTFHDKRHLRRHYQRIHLKYLPFKCNTCSFACFSQQSMRVHVESHLDAAEKDHLCTICGQRYGLEQMRIHKLKAHKTLGEYECNICKKMFGNAKRLLDHHRLEHSDAQLVINGRDALKCNQCDKVFTRNKGLKSHIKRVHLEFGKIQCEQCGLTVTTNFGLYQHKANVHGSDVQFSCGECGKQFAHKSTYERHKEKAHGDSSVQCQECHGTFKHKESLRLHIKTIHQKHLHTKCPYCNKTFAKRYMNRMRDHIREKHPGKVIEQEANDVEGLPINV